MKRFIVPFFFFLLFLPAKGYAADNLQQIIDGAEAGATVHLDNQTYEGNIMITKSLKIIGGKDTVIKGDGTGNVISVRAPGVTLSHLTVTHSSMDRNSSEEYAAIKVYTDHNVLSHLIIRDSFHGVYLSQAHENTVEFVDIKGLGKGEIANQGNGLHIYYSNENTLRNNTISGTRDGMFFDYANDNIVLDNTISETRYGLHYMYSDKNHFKGNTFTLNTGGAAVMHSNGLNLSENEFVFNYGHRSFGLLLLSSNNLSVTNNTFFFNQRGMYIDQSTDNEIFNNRIVKNQIGIELWASSNGQIFSANQIHENTIPAVTLGGQGQNKWNNGEVGNDWGPSFPLTDLNQDGIGEQQVAYHLALHELIENQELTYLFLKSPAVAVYEKIYGLFQQDKMMFEDPYPLVSHQQNNQRWFWFVFIGIVSLAILQKGRKRLCITFGKNGRKV